MAAAISGEDPTEAQLEAVKAYREARNYDEPILDRYANWIIGYSTLNWGYSFDHGQPVTDVIADRLPVTLVYLVPGILLALLLGLAIVSLGTLLFATGTLAVLVTTLFLAVGMMAMLPVVQAYLFDQFPDGNLGGDYGAAKTIFTGAGSLGPTYLGLLVTVVGYTTAFATLGIYLVIAAGLILSLSEGS
jgi:MFS family permease